MRSNPFLDAEGYKAAVATLQEVGRRARIFMSMPIVEGITPKALADSPRAEDYPTSEPVPRRHGIFKPDEIGLSPFDHIGLYGDGVFEGILIKHGRIFLMREHVERLWRSLEMARIGMPYDPVELTWHVLECSRQVGFTKEDTGYLRLVVTRGLGDLGINPKKCVGCTVFNIASTIRLYPPQKYEEGIELGIAKTVRRPGAAILDPTVKSCNYLNNVFGLLESALDAGYMEGIMLTERGFIAEATVDNLFLVEYGEGWEHDPSRVTVSTPSPEYCLNGITRATIMSIARDCGYTVVESPTMLPADLIGPEREVFITGTGAGVMPVVGVRGVPVGDGRPGPVTRRLIGHYDEMMRDPRFGLALDADRAAVESYLAGTGD